MYYVRKRRGRKTFTDKYATLAEARKEGVKHFGSHFFKKVWLENQKGTFLPF